MKRFKEDDYKDINERVKETRRTMKLSQEEMAEKLEVTRGTLSHIEINRSNVTISMLRRMKRQFNLPYDYIIDGEETPNVGDLKKEIAKLQEQVHYLTETNKNLNKLINLKS